MSARGRLLLLLVLLLCVSIFVWSKSRPFRSSPAPTNALQVIQAFEEKAAHQHWAPELAAEEYGRTIERLWDDINAASNKLAVVAATKIATVTLPTYQAPDQMPHGIQSFAPGTNVRSLSSPEWQTLLTVAQNDGWSLAQCEFRHVGFTLQPPRSRYSFAAHLANTNRDERAILEGDLDIGWAGATFSSVDARAVSLKMRHGPIAFQQVVHEEVSPVPGSYFIDPLVAWDLDGDGSPEIVLITRNLVFRRKPDGVWTSTPLCAHPAGLFFTGALGDFNGDGLLDLLCADFDGLLLYESLTDGQFPNPPRRVWKAQPRLRYAQALALGDVDGDGDIDLYLGQYKVPYEKGQMPKPYFDGNDGHPSFLLLNDGHGNFTDATQNAGLGAKRGRRVYNASFVDLDGDGDLDLLTTSDFAGIDAYANDGHGNFRDVTSTWLPEHAGLGMANCFADFNRDGRLDVLMVGMNSPTADRLASLGLARPYDLPDAGQRSALTYGNRLLFGQPDGSFRAGPASSAVARTGWSWGCAAEDLDNDGWPDLYIANGHETRASVRDYEPEFWLHDIYIGDSADNSLAAAYFQEKMSRTRGRGWSYGGYEKNRFFLNLGGTNFLECAWLLGLALESDSRNVIAEDFDGDGRLDLALTTFELFPRVRQTLQVYLNRLPVDRLAKITRFNDLKQSGKVLHTNGLTEASLSSGSFRSQVQPRTVELYSAPTAH